MLRKVHRCVENGISQTESSHKPFISTSISFHYNALQLLENNVWWKHEFNTSFALANFLVDSFPFLNIFTTTRLLKLFLALTLNQVVYLFDI